MNPRPWDYDSCSTSNVSIGYRHHVARMSHQRGLYRARSLSVPLSLEAAGIEFIKEERGGDLERFARVESTNESEFARPSRARRLG